MTLPLILEGEGEKPADLTYGPIHGYNRPNIFYCDLKI